MRQRLTNARGSQCVNKQRQDAFKQVDRFKHADKKCKIRTCVNVPCSQIQKLHMSGQVQLQNTIRRTLLLLFDRTLHFYLSCIFISSLAPNLCDIEWKTP